VLKHTFVLTACAVAMATLLTTLSTQAHGPTRMNYLTFNSAVSLPGVVLAPGKYAFESGPNDTDRAIVRVMSADRQRVHYLGLTTAVTRPANLAPGQLVLLGEARIGEPTSIKAWYPSNSSTGREFRW
jgi:hypothetical protein